MHPRSVDIRQMEKKSLSRIPSSSFKEFYAEDYLQVFSCEEVTVWKPPKTTAMRYGLANEEIARKSYSSKYLIDVKEVVYLSIFKTHIFARLPMVLLGQTI
ncbi:hypothetical protein TNIN_35421 [Trichonephila inaurata madagascariensis]|uniref:Uncharacterized protein n=1 Tax=Trichonephila inaurata madagascariensis TaxID=2747483 RepID=A0A8X6YR81_9ARAC|nr:hypothetical protein TNIN_35421 [Trichonephila inaurata madagascariensis]